MPRTPTQKTITRESVARRAGVSSATVSYVINDGPRPVSPKTRQKVLKAIAELGYQPNAVARNLRRQRTTTLGLVIPDTFNPYFSEVARGIEGVAFEHGYIVILCHSRYSAENEKKYGDVLNAERAAGVLWIPATGDHGLASKLRGYNIPLVLLDRLVEDEDVFSVVADNYRGGELAVNHLISLGHQRIGFVGRAEPLPHSSERMRGYMTTMEAQGLAVDEGLIVMANGYTYEDGLRTGRELLIRPDRPTAIFAYSDIMAIGVMRAALELGLSVPGDLSIVGFDDIPTAAMTYPALTTISQPKLEMGRYSAEILLRLINGESIEDGPRVTMDVHLVVRESSGPPRA